MQRQRRRALTWRLPVDGEKKRKGKEVQSNEK